MTIKQGAQRFKAGLRLFQGVCSGMGVVIALWILAQNAAADSAQPAVPARCDWSDQQYVDFYVPPELGELTPDRLGELLRIEHVRSFTPEEVAEVVDQPSSPYGAEVYRILYLSQAPPGVPRAVSGLLGIPTGEMPADGFPVIAHGHATSGLADVCANSKYDASVNDLLFWLVHGYAVVATDYVGLGTPGVHPYAVGEAEAFSMWDGVRAARRFCDSQRDIAGRLSSRVILEGHSQGGHAALFAHQIGSTYAPEFRLLGTVAFAPGAEPRILVERMVDRRSPLMAPGILAMYAYQEYYDTSSNLQTWLQEPYASELPTRVEEQCAVGITFWLGNRPERVFQPALITAVEEGRWQDLEPWTTLIEINTPGSFSSPAPILILQGQRDNVIPPSASERLTWRLCAKGTSVYLSRYPIAGHGTITLLGNNEAVRWMNDRVAGRLAPTSCADFSYNQIALPLVVR